MRCFTDRDRSGLISALEAAACRGIRVTPWNDLAPVCQRLYNTLVHLHGSLDGSRFVWHCCISARHEAWPDWGQPGLPLPDGAVEDGEVTFTVDLLADVSLSPGAMDALATRGSGIGNPLRRRLQFEWHAWESSFPLDRFQRFSQSLHQSVVDYDARLERELCGCWERSEAPPIVGERFE